VLSLAGGLVGGLLAGVGLVFGREMLRRTIVEPERLEARLGKPVYAVVPHSRSQRRLARRAATGYALLSRDDPDDLAVEALRSLRTSLAFGLAHKSLNVVALTSPGPEAGKTFAAANLSYLMARGGKRVLLIDADLRRGHAHAYFGRARRGIGLSDVLAGQSSIEAARTSADVDTVRLDLLSTGTLPPNPSELLMRPEFAALIAEQAANYDCIVVDTAPVLAVTDGTLAAAVAGAVLMVVRAGRTREAEVRASIRRLEQNGTAVTGLLLNDFDPARSGAAPYYYYQSEYRRAP
jgi:tyrosine-protein kinase Etk/Wzc